MLELHGIGVLLPTALLLQSIHIGFAADLQETEDGNRFLLDTVQHI